MSPARLVFYAATAATFVLVGRSILLAPPPLEWAVLAIFSYVGLMTTGVLVLRLRMFVDALVRGPRGARGVVLTFDDGPDPVWTPRVLDALDAANAKATFFLIGRKVAKYPEVAKEIVSRGHTIGLHSYEHDRLFSFRSSRVVKRDLERGLDAISAATGLRPSLFRPPIGHTNPTIARVVDELDLTVIGWSVGGRDGLASADPERVVARVRGKAKDGSIVLLHDAAERESHEPAGPRALPGILEALAEARLAVVPLAAWVDEGDQLRKAAGKETEKRAPDA